MKREEREGNRERGFINTAKTGIKRDIVNSPHPHLEWSFFIPDTYMRTQIKGASSF